MLLTSRARRTVVILPLLVLTFASVMGGVAVSAFFKGSWGVVIGCGLFSSFCFWMAFDALVVLRVDGGALRLWGPFRRRELRAEACTFGVRLQAGARSSRYVVFGTDAQASVDLGEWQTERGARRGIQRLQQALYGDAPRSPSTRAEREVEQVERAWQATMAEAQKSVDAYYQSPAWRRGKYLVIGLVVTYVVGMMLYQYFSGQL